MRGLTRPLVTLIATAALATGAVAATAPAAFARAAAADAPPPLDHASCKKAMQGLRGSLPKLAETVDQATLDTVRQDINESIADLASNKVPKTEKLVQDLTELGDQLPKEQLPHLLEVVAPAVNKCLPGTASSTS
ncbi:hypothetical protein ACQB60_43980 [Actinomycetota bacterium Odt1-20B]